ncbi:short-chain dehydrogenase/reductase family 9C member 7 isoform X2 [Sarcophilus harrisii]|uniref:short-chain dehydrogenase/reductase family 9C member 7 isoform X2 n=1 Tax=Sarcophilus harrisii TaxID=9305 RepID=UPI001301FB0C|nr:short-chain dehydrogenase/reductase family 9C member 7 isoform X2 [Sarcophilus harrisii]
MIFQAYQNLFQLYFSQFISCYSPPFTLYSSQPGLLAIPGTWHFVSLYCVSCEFQNGEGAQRLRQEAGGSCRMHVFKLDVTQDQDVVDAKDFLLKNLPEKALWGLVNNAGLALCGKMEWISFDDLKKVIDVNVLGSIRTTLKLLPLIKKSQGFSY